MSDPHIRVRFAPSPTGTLHLGSARSALYNWLVARHAGADGTYILRIEDTDQERSTPEHVQQALRVFRWLGLEWDEGPDVEGAYGPYYQSARDEQYLAALHQLQAADRAYPCFCTKEQLDADRAQAKADNAPQIYAGRCRGIDAETRERRISAGDSHVIRFAAPLDGVTIVDDMVLGESRFENALIGDIVIARADGSPLYNFANVIDDAAMKITHVIRGNDHLSNTPRQIQLYEALGYEPPRFAHVPMILGPDGAKLSKRRHHTATVEQLAEEGYVAQAVRNGLALLGWNRDDDTTIMGTDELIAAFDITRVRKSPAAVDYDKLRHINATHLRAMEPSEWAAEYDQWRDVWTPVGHDHHFAAHAASPELAASLLQEKVEVFGQVPGMIEFLLDPFVVTDEAWERLIKVEPAERVLEEASRLLAAMEPFTVEAVEQGLRDLCASLELKPRVVFAPIRFAVTGHVVTPGLFESIVALGQERSIDRIRHTLVRLGERVGANAS